jgi:Tol biopolymer transport system component
MGLISGPEFVGVTTAGAVQLFSVTTGMATATLTSAGDAVGDAVAVAPHGSTVYFTVKRKCQDYIESVPVSGGTPSTVVAGALPAISPDGTKLAFAREPASALTAVQQGCQGSAAGAQNPGQDYQVVVRDLATGSEKAYPAPPGSTSQPYPISHLSWSPSGATLLISLGQGQDHEGWLDLHLLDLATAKNYLAPSWPTTSGADVPVTGSPDAAAAGPGQSNTAVSYYSEGVFLPDGGIFADRVCCTGVPAHVTSSLLEEISTKGQLVHQVAIGYPNAAHSSLDGSGDWVIYLSAHNLYAAEGAQAARLITGGLIAAAWLSSS